MKKILKKVRIFLEGLFGGMKVTEELTLHQNGGDNGQNIVINQKVEDRTVAQALLKGELTQAVQELRYRTYMVEREANHYNYISPLLCKKKEDKDYKYTEGSIYNNDKFSVLTIQENFLETETVVETLNRSENGKYIKRKNKYHIALNRDKFVFPKFKLEDFLKKVVVFEPDETNHSIVDLYITRLENPSIFGSRAFLKEFDNIIKGDNRSDILNIKSIEFETLKAFHKDDMLHYKFDDIKVKTFIEFGSCNIVRTYCNIVDNGSDKIEKFYSPTMAEKYKKKEPKKLTYNWDPSQQTKTYVCEECGKTVICNPQESLEYVDYEISKFDLGKMLCKDCQIKHQKELINQINK